MPEDPLTTRADGGIDRILGRPWAFLATAALLLMLFGWTFVDNPGRPAAADDPAYYAWRTEALIANDPQTLLDIDGPLDMYSGGYRVATPIVAGLIRQVADVSPLAPTAILAVGLRVVIPLLLAGFAYRWRRDPLVWHSVAIGSASLLLTPPFAGYLDNMMALLFLTASLYLIDGARTSWPARGGIAACLLLAGLTHPTTLAIFCVVLGVMAAVRLVYRHFDVRSVVRDDGPVLMSAFAAAIATYAVWKIGVWGEPASLGEAALPPPAPAEFFKTRLNDWVAALRPALNGPLFLAGAAGLLGGGRRAAENELARVGIVWLAPLVGIAGVFAGLTYPYYRFFNTTLAWVLLIGLGAYFICRYVIGIARRGGANAVALVAVAAIAFVFATNFTAGFDKSNWNDPGDAWIRPDERRDLDALRRTLITGNIGRPVVFVVDDDVAEPVRIYGFAKRAGNVSRYGVPGSSQDRTGFYLGSLESFIAGEATTRDAYYEDLSQASLDDVEAFGDAPIVVVAEVFNRTGANAAAFADGGIRLEVSDGASIVYLQDGQVGDQVPPADDETGSPIGLLVSILGGVALVLPGLVMFRAMVPDARMSDVGMVAALSVVLLGAVGFAVLAVMGGPLTAGTAWLVLVISLAIAIVARMSARPAAQ